MRISCSIVCYQNPPDQIAHVLSSVSKSIAANASLKAVITVVDNSESDQLADVAHRFNAQYIHLPHNPGFGAAHNTAIRNSVAVGGAYHLVLNPDTYFEEHVISALVDFMEGNRDVGLVMPDIRYPDGRRQHLCKLLPGPADLIMRRFAPFIYKSSGRLARYELHESGYDRIMDVPALSGCFMLIRASVLREVGGFDERFFMYLEDVDLSRRIGRVARTVYFPHVSITHEYVKGSYKNRKLLFHHIRSAIRYFNKWGWIKDNEKDRVNRRALRKIRFSRPVSG